MNCCDSQNYLKPTCAVRSDKIKDLVHVIWLRQYTKFVLICILIWSNVSCKNSFFWGRLGNSFIELRYSISIVLGMTHVAFKVLNLNCEVRLDEKYDFYAKYEILPNLLFKLLEATSFSGKSTKQAPGSSWKCVYLARIDLSLYLHQTALLYFD